MTNVDNLRLEIDKQIAAGFSADEIRTNLKAQAFSPQDIDAAMKQNNVAAKAKTSPGIGIVSVLVSVYFIFNGIMKMSKYESGSGLYIFGLIMMSVGIGGLIFKLVELSRK
jgi:ABC-type spermidine/putrescine transport system permease subunit II